jgi:hypothetical protein
MLEFRKRAGRLTNPLLYTCDEIELWEYSFEKSMARLNSKVVGATAQFFTGMWNFLRQGY